MSFILASGSPRRKELLEMLNVRNMKIIPAKGEENIPENAGPGEIVMALAAAKGREVAANCGKDDTVISADTIVWHEGRVYGKPHSESEARAFLRSLSDNTHEVYTGVCVIHGGRECVEYEMSRVTFRELDDEEIEAYIANGEPMDKAGAYGAQGIGALFVRKIDGDFFNVMGLPLCRLGEMLKKQGVKLL